MREAGILLLIKNNPMICLLNLFEKQGLVKVISIKLQIVL